MKRTKGYCSTKPYRCRGWHYVSEKDNTQSACGRARIAITADGVNELPPKARNAFRRLQRCDYCDRL